MFLLPKKYNKPTNKSKRLPLNKMHWERRLFLRIFSKEKRQRKNVCNKTNWKAITLIETKAIINTKRTKYFRLNVRYPIYIAAQLCFWRDKLHRIYYWILSRWRNVRNIKFFLIKKNNNKNRFYHLKNLIKFNED